MARYEDMLAALLGARRFGVRFELSRVTDALARLGSPELRIGRVIHVGGTNGKGSTAAMCESILRAAGAKTGLYTSPHLSRFTERVRIAGREIDGGALAGLWGRARGVIGELTFFEQATILALMAFAEAGVEATVLEVGLGGRLDATNVVDADVAVVTGVALDHTDVLGSTLEAIAAEKAGIFKAGRAAVIGAGEMADELERLAVARGARPVRAPAAPPEGWTVGLRGAHQVRNAACALAAVRALGIADEAARRGLAAARWPGRLEQIGDVLLDAAHNPEGARALARELGQGMVAVVAVSADKDAGGILAPLLPHLRELIATEAPSARAMPAEALAQAAPHARVVPDWREALHTARGVAGPNGRVLVCGSIFLVGAVRAHLLGEPVDPVVAQDPPPGKLPG